MDIEWIQRNVICKDKRGRRYRIITGAKDVQTEDLLVIYEQLYDDREVLSCPFHAFSVSYEPVNEDEPIVTELMENSDRATRLFDTKDFEEKVRLLKEMYILGELTDNLVDNIAATLDVVIKKGDLETRYDDLRICVETRAKYETGRLRT